jgi:AcrR family transcriptional regulator
MKQQILTKAIELLNTHSINKTSFRDIALELGLSDGHVRYYFKTKEILLLEIFKQLDEEVMDAAGQVESNPDVQKLIKAQLKTAFTTMVRYRFIFYEPPATFGQFPKLQAAYKQLLQDRKALFLSVFQDLIRVGFFKADFTADKQEKVFYALFVFSDSWIRYYTIMSHSAPDEEAITFHSEVAFGMLEEYIQ